MPTEFQSLLDQGEAFLDNADSETVTIAGFPQPLPANIGSIYRRSVMTDNGYRLQMRGTVEIRRAVLEELAPGIKDPVSHTDITVRGKTYRVDFTSGDTTTLRIDFAAFS